MRALIGLVCAAIVLTGCSATNADSSSSDPQSGGATSSVDASPAAEAVPTWFSIVNPKIQRLEQSITLAQVSARRPGHRGLIAACRQIKSNVALVQAAPTSSDKVVRTALTSEMRAFARAADQCVAGNLDASGHSVNAGHRYEEVVLRRLDILLPATRRSA